MSDDNKMPETEPSPLVKARFFGAGRDGSEHSNVLETPDEQTALFNEAGAIAPPLDPLSLANLYEMSGPLRSSISSYAVNVDSFGYELEPVIDPDADEAEEKIKLAITQERMAAGEQRDPDIDAILKEAKDLIDDPGEGHDPSDKEVKARMASIRREMIRERMAADKFFAFVAHEASFEQLRMQTREDMEITGNAYWEVLRNTAGEIVQFDHVPGFSVRLMPQERQAQPIEMHVRTTAITTTTEPVQKRFRKYVQIAHGSVRDKNLVWFKEFGDTRIYSHATGKQYASIEEMQAKEENAYPATELIHFKVHSARSVYRAAPLGVRDARGPRLAPCRRDQPRLLREQKASRRWPSSFPAAAW